MPSPPSITDLINRLEQRRNRYGDVYIQSILERHEHGPRNVFTVIRPLALDEQSPKLFDYCYPSHFLFSQRITLDEFIVRLHRASQPEQVLGFGDPGRFFKIQPSINDRGLELEDRLCPWPAERITLTVQGERGQPPRDALVSLEAPLYANLADAVVSNFQVREFHESSDALIGDCVVLVPHYVGKLDRIKLSGSGVTIRAVGDGLTEGLVCQVLVRPPDPARPAVRTTIQVPATGDMEITTDFLPASVLVYLLDAQGGILDHGNSGHAHHFRYRKLFEWPSVPQPNAADDIGRLRGGESESVEFKPCVDPQHKEKFIEVVQSCCGFANANGGFLYLGVTNDGAPVGLERYADSPFMKVLKKLYERYGVKTPEEFLSRYRHEVQEKLAETITPSIPLTIEPVRIGDRTILCLEVKSGHGLHQLINERRSYIRRGATTRQAELDDLLKAARRDTSSGTSPSFFSRLWTAPSDHVTSAKEI